MADELRPYQKLIVDQTRESFQAGVKSVIVNLATGGGKTMLTADMLRTCAQKRMHSWFVVHRRELVRQVVLALDYMKVPHDIIASGFIETRSHLTKVCSIGALRSRAKTMTPPNLIVVDEAHHTPAASWDKILAMFPKAYRIGLTATPERLDGQGLGKYYDKIIKGPSVRWLIENGFLSDYRIFAPADISTEGLHTRAGDYAREEVVARANTSVVTGNALNEYLKHAMGKRAVIFCASVQHSEDVVKAFNANGIPAAHVDGETDTYSRDKTIKDFQDGKILCLSNVDLFGEGFDLPTLECVILLRPTQSLGLYRQQVGRALRPSPGKTHAIILDHAGNVSRHGLPEDDIEWSLEGNAAKKRKNEEKETRVKICPKCLAAQFPGPKCKFCGYPFQVQSREVEQKEGELKEMDIKAIKKARSKEVGKANTYEELVALGISRGYKDPQTWAHKMMEWKKDKGIVV